MNKIKLKRVFKGWPITQSYGETPFAKKHPSYYINGIHKGIDFGVSSGTPIKAAHDGIVVKDDDSDNSAIGIYVTLWDKNQNIATRYYHMKYNTVKNNEFIKTGEIIGYVGNSGLSTGSHLHFEIVRVDDNGYVIGKDKRELGTIDPMNPNLVKWIE